MKKILTIGSIIAVAIIPITTVISCNGTTTHNGKDKETIKKAIQNIAALKETLHQSNAYTLDGSNYASYLTFKPSIIKEINNIQGLPYTISVKRGNTKTNGATGLSDMSTPPKDSKDQDGNPLPDPNMIAGSDASQISNLKLQTDDTLIFNFGIGGMLTKDQSTITIPIIANNDFSLEKYVNKSFPGLYDKLDSLKIGDQFMLDNLYWKQKISEIFLDVKNVRENSTSDSFLVDRIFKDLYGIFVDGKGSEFNKIITNLIDSFKSKSEFSAFVQSFSLAKNTTQSNNIFSTIFGTITDEEFTNLKTALKNIFLSSDLKNLFKAFSIKGAIRNNIISKVLWIIPPLLNIDLDLPSILGSVVSKIPGQLEQVLPTPYRQELLDASANKNDPQKLNQNQVKNQQKILNTEAEDQAKSRRKAVDPVIDTILTDILKVHNYRYAQDIQDESGNITHHQGDYRPWKYKVYSKEALKDNSDLKNDQDRIKANTFDNHFKLYIKNNETSIRQFSAGMETIIKIFHSKGLFSKLTTKKVAGLDLGTLLDDNIFPLFEDLFNIDKVVSQTPSPDATSTATIATPLYQPDDLSDSYKFSSKLMYNLFYGVNLTLSITTSSGLSIKLDTALNISQIFKLLVSGDPKGNIGGLLEFIGTSGLIPQGQDPIQYAQLQIAKLIVDKNGKAISFKDYITQLIDGFL